jgi:anthranilate phosphoribosyltransferase
MKSEMMNSSLEGIVFARSALQKLIEHRELYFDEMLPLMRHIMHGEIPPVLVSAIITALRVKKETIGEITAAAMVLRESSLKVEALNKEHLVDIVGTGGDGSNTFNISTCSMFVAAGAGAQVAKVGGRSVSSTSGSADVLEALGVNIDLKPEQIAQCLNQIGLGFMFSQNHHGAMKNVAPIRRDLGIKTIFNILGPLTNPADAKNVLVGVFHPDLVGIMVRVLQRLGIVRALVVHGKDGVDELTLGAATLIGELKNGQISEYEVQPENFGLAIMDRRAVQVASSHESKAMLLGVLDGQDNAARTITTFNAGAALYVSGKAATIAEGIALADASIQSGRAKQKLLDLIRLSQAFGRDSIVKN